MANKKKTAKRTKRPKKPEEKTALLEALLLRLVSPLNALPVQTLEGVAYIRPEDIAYIRTSPSLDDKSLQVYDVEGGEWALFSTLTGLMEKLAPDPRFCKAHRSFIVNAFAVKAILRDPKTGRKEATFGDLVIGQAGVSDSGFAKLKPILELDL